MGVKFGRKDYKPKAFEKRVIRRIYGPKRENW
jgi:hypothetical protein